MVYVRVWKFRPREDMVDEFKTAYGPNGAWARLFHRAQGFLGTMLLEGNEYLTIDRWATKAAYERFLRRFSEDFAALDRRCEAMTELEELIGEYEES
jgi:hypothetical protein